MDRRKNNLVQKEFNKNSSRRSTARGAWKTTISSLREAIVRKFVCFFFHCLYTFTHCTLKITFPMRSKRSFVQSEGSTVNPFSLPTNLAVYSQLCNHYQRTSFPHTLCCITFCNIAKCTRHYYANRNKEKLCRHIHRYNAQNIFQKGIDYYYVQNKRIIYK